MENESLEDFAFSGPLTLTKIHKILSIEKTCDQIDRRATLEVSQPSRTIYSDSPTTDYLIRMQLHDKEEYELNSSFINEYLQVPNKNSTDGESSTFIEQLSEALELSNREPEQDSVIIISDEEDLCNSLSNSNISVIEENQEQQSAQHVGTVLDCKVEKNSPKKEHEKVTFDDTFNEIEMALKYGLDYSIPGDDVSGISDEKESSSELNVCTPSLVGDAVGGNSESVIHDKNDELISEVNVPVRSLMINSEDYLGSSGSSDEGSFKVNKNCKIPKINKPSALHSANCQRTSEKKLKHDAEHFVFKQPTPKLQPSSKSRNFKNVVSPVGIYIRSLKSPIKRTVQNSNVKSLFVSPEPVINVKRSNEDELPKVIYKPPRCVITTTESTIKLPSNIKKILPSPTTVIKHEGRLGPVNRNQKELSEQLLHDDLSIAADLSHLNNSIPPESLDEVSFHHEKKIFIS